MLPFFDPIRTLTTASVVVRMVCAMLCSGLIGTEREYKRRSAGFRTHILICLGACITALTGQYLALNMHYVTDMTRIGAQVVAGIGFIGAGAIILTPRNRVRGLTTSAGLWTCGCIGLAFGSGFYEGGFLTTFLVLFAEIVLSQGEFWMKAHAPRTLVYLEYTKVLTLENFEEFLQGHGIHIESTELEKIIQPDKNASGTKKKINCAYVYVCIPRGMKTDFIENYAHADGDILELNLL
ncbi:MAG: MgtC/SapB family protein [Lachnospiraceae bacterium]|nr:MgtC/SapB family protein [Lachnospiraceae bacterium]